MAYICEYQLFSSSAIAFFQKIEINENKKC